MKAFLIALMIGAALALQTSLAVFLSPGADLIDLVLVAVVYIALAEGPTVGLLVGAIAGLTQDALGATGSSQVAFGAGVAVTRSIIGIGGLAKTVVGFVAGIVGSQFIVARPLPRAFVFFTATMAHAIMFMGLYRLLDARYVEAPLVTMLSQAAANAVVGVLVFQIADSFPGFVDRRRSAGGSMRINRRLD